MLWKGCGAAAVCRNSRQHRCTTQASQPPRHKHTAADGTPAACTPWERHPSCFSSAQLDGTPDFNLLIIALIIAVIYCCFIFNLTSRMSSSAIAVLLSDSVFCHQLSFKSFRRSRAAAEGLPPPAEKGMKPKADARWALLPWTCCRLSLPVVEVGGSEREYQ